MWAAHGVSCTGTRNINGRVWVPTSDWMSSAAGTSCHINHGMTKNHLTNRKLRFLSIAGIDVYRLLDCKKV